MAYADTCTQLQQLSDDGRLTAKDCLRGAETVMLSEFGKSIIALFLIKSQAYPFNPLGRHIESQQGRKPRS
jgi:hypothetical protein